MQRRSAVIKLCTFCPLSFLGEGAGTVPCSGAEVSCDRVDAKVECRNKIVHVRSLLLLDEGAGTVPCSGTEVSCDRVDAKAECRNKIVVRSIPSPFGLGSHFWCRDDLQKS